MLPIAGLALLVVVLFKGGIAGLRQLTAAFLPIILIVVLIVWLTARSRTASKLASGAMRASMSVARGVASAGYAGTKASAGALSRSGAFSFVVVIRRFRIKDVLGNTTSCVLIGQVDGDLMRQGDLVRVPGRRDRDGLVTTKVVQVLDRLDRPPRLIVRSHRTLGYRAAQALDVLAKLASAVIILLIVAILTGWPKG